MVGAQFTPIISLRRFSLLVILQNPLHKMVKKNPPGFIPEVGQGVIAKKYQEGSEGGKEWLKEKSLHKYWPMFSQWSYETFTTLTEDCLDERMAEVGAEGLTRGARGAILRAVAELRERDERLSRIAARLAEPSGDPKELVSSSLDYIAKVLRTPLPTAVRHPLPFAIVAVLIQVKNFAEKECLKQLTPRVQDLVRLMTLRPVMQEAISTLVQDILRRTQKQITTEEDDWYKPSSEDVGVWPQGENSVMFTIWPRF